MTIILFYKENIKTKPIKHELAIGYLVLVLMTIIY